MKQLSIFDNELGPIKCRISIPASEIIAFIFGQQERLARVYEDLQDQHRISPGLKSSTFHC